MATITSDATKHVAKLAKLDLTNEEIEKFTKQLANVLGHIDELSEVDVENTEPTSQTTGLTNVLREDEIDITNCLPLEDRQFEVAQIIQK